MPHFCMKKGYLAKSQHLRGPASRSDLGQNNELDAITPVSFPSDIVLSPPNLGCLQSVSAVEQLSHLSPINHFNSILKHCLSFIKSFPKTSVIFKKMNTLLGSIEAILETLILSVLMTSH